ncbi:MAG: hypothetical protein ACRDG7_14540 [Candidatus Limnocylindria bacterium]
MLATTLGTSLILLSACGGLSRPDRVVEPDAAGLIVRVDRSDPSREVVELEGGETIEFDGTDALELAGPGIDSDRVLIFGDTGGRDWYATASTSETPAPGACYILDGDAAFDEPDAVLMVFVEWRDTAIELSKRDDFSVPPGTIRSDARYEGGEVPAASVCIDSNGLVFGLP